MAIVVPIRFSVFSSGFASVAINLYDYLKEFGFDPVFLNICGDDTMWYDDCSSLKAHYTVESFEKKFKDKATYDLLIDIDGILTGELRRAIAKKIVILLRKPAIFNDVEFIVYPVPEFLRKSPRYIEDVDAIWVYDNFSEYDIQYLQLLAGDTVPIFRVPFLWRPKIIEAHNSETKFPHWSSGPSGSSGSGGAVNAPWHPHVMETNMSNTSACIFPMVVLRQLALSAEKKTFKFQEYTIHNMEQFNNSDYFRDNIKKNTEHEDLKANFIGRQRVVDLVIQPKTCLLSHLRFLTFRPMLIDAIWVGIPVIHNSLLLKDLGCGLERFYYRDNDILEVVQAFKCMEADFNEGSGYFSKETQIELRKKILERFGGITEAHRGAWEIALNTLGSVSPPIKNTVISVEFTADDKSDRRDDATTNRSISLIEVDSSPKKTYTILFTDMWDDFNPQYNFFLLLLGSVAHVVGHNLTTIKDVTPDLVIYGPFGESYRLFPDIPKVHFTGENTEPIYENNTRLNLGYSLLERSDDSYMRIPLWLLEIDWFNADPDQIINPKPIPIDRVRKVFPDEMETHQSRFCAFVVTNPMNSLRNSSFHWLSQYKQVDSAGRLFNNVGDEIFAGRGGGGGELLKHKFLKRYKFCLCFENSSAEGYTTEKLLHAKAAGCIPIYWGDPKVSRDFNEAGFLNAQGIRSPEDLISLVREIDQNQAKYEAMYNQPLLDDYKFELAHRRLTELRRRIWHILDPNVNQIVPAIKNSPSPVYSMEQLIGSMVLLTFATAKFLPSLQGWLQTVLQFKERIKGIEPHVYLGDDISDELKAALENAAKGVFFHRLPTVTHSVPGFDDFWAPEHFAWKLWLLNDTVRNSNDTGRLIFYMDCGAMLIKIPFDYIRATMEKGICFLEDPRQTNRQWCSQEFCNELQVTEAEKNRNQIWAGSMMFVGSSGLATRIFSEAVKLAEKRNVVVGPKWAGIGADGKPFGHRHDQSILSILSQRLNIPLFPLDKVYNGYSLRRTFRSECALYVHRGNFTQHKEFMPRISEAYVIHLKRRVDRLERFYNNHPGFQEQVIVQEACDGLTLRLTNALRRLFVSNDFHWKKAVLGCAMSHLTLWWNLSKEEDCIENYLITEDDVKFLPSFQKVWEEAAQHIPEDYDILYLGGILPPNKVGYQTVLEPVNSHWSRIAENQIFGQQEPTRYFHVCNYSYIISKKAAKKILELIMNRGYYTSADHMICNQIHSLKHYFLSPLMAGCYQDDDPKYANSAFNDFNRIDKFDSDLWNNDERFTSEPVPNEEQISFEKAIEDAFYAEEITSVINTEAFVKSSSVPLEESQPQLQKQKHFYTIFPHTVEIKDIMELRWLHDLIDPERQFGKGFELPLLDIVEVIDPTAVVLQYPTDTLGETRLQYPVPPIFIVQRPHVELYAKYFQRLAGQSFYAWHISDEYGTDDISWYSACKGVVRNYLRPGLDSNNVVVIPLGYSKTTTDRIENQIYQTPSLPFRELVWSFRGTGWQNRVALLSPCQGLEPSVCEFYDAWKSPQQADHFKYIGELLNSKFVLCPGGMNPETFRFYEALEMGAIPIYVRSPNDDAYFKWIFDALKIVPIMSWEEARGTMEYLLSHPEFMDRYRTVLLTNWIEWKKRCINDIKRIWNL